MDMNSTPLVIGDDVYFAARDKVVCLDRLTGKLIWETNIDPELESMSLYEISDGEIALVGEGKKILSPINKINSKRGWKSNRRLYDGQ